MLLPVRLAAGGWSAMADSGRVQAPGTGDCTSLRMVAWCWQTVQALTGLAMRAPCLTGAAGIQSADDAQVVGAQGLPRPCMR